MFYDSSMEDTERAWKNIFIIWMAIFASLGVYLVVCHLYGSLSQTKPSISFPLKDLRIILYLVSLIFILGASYLKKFILTMKQEVLPEQATESYVTSSIGRYFVVTLVSCALIEAVGVCGVVIFFIYRDFQSLYSFILVSAVFMYLLRPKKSELVEFVNRERV